MKLREWKTAVYGRVVFGASAVLFGVISLMWHDADTWQTLRETWRLPFGGVIGGFLMVLQIAGGLMMQFPKWIPPGQMFWTILATLAFGLAALAMLVNRQGQLASRLMTLMLGLFGALVWVPRLVAHAEADGNWSELALTFLITGAAWMVAELKAS